MSPKEKKELVGYLKNETDRLDKAIRKAHETERLGRVTHYEQMRDAFASILSKLISETKKTGLLLVAALVTTVFMLFIPSVSGAQTKMQNTQNVLEGKTFVIQVYDYSPDGKKTGTYKQDELTFIGGRLSSKVMSKEYIFAPGSYSVKGDSSVIAFAADNINLLNGGETIFWLGAVKNDTIEGTMKWFSKGMTKMFWGTLKYKDEEK